MGFLARLDTVAAPASIQATTSPTSAFLQGYDVPDLWVSSLRASGVSLTPELAMTLAAFYSGVTMIGYDLATLPCQVFQVREDGGKDRVRGLGRAGLEGGGIGSLAYKLRWQPNEIQTASDFFLSLVAQFLMRGVAYAEITRGPGGFLDQLLPRHPDRVRVERLASGRVRYQLVEPGGQTRTVTQEEMFVVRDLSFDGGLSSVSRVEFGATTLGSALASQRAQAKFFKSGMTAAVVATYTGDMDDEGEANLHASISRYAAGVENSFGLMVIPDDVKIDNLAVDPQKAQMMESQGWGVREVARLLRMPPSKLGVEGANAYASQVQQALEYVIQTLRPIAYMVEQSIQRDLIIAKLRYVAEFKLEALLRGDFESQATYIEKFIRSRVMRPSEARRILNMNPDPKLDALSEGDFRPGSSQPSGGQSNGDGEPAASRRARADVKGLLAVHDSAARCVRRERVAVEKLATRHADDPDGWGVGLRDFYTNHASFVAETMRIPVGAARAYVAAHGDEIETRGVGVMSDDWARTEADELAILALD